MFGSLNDFELHNLICKMQDAATKTFREANRPRDFDTYKELHAISAEILAVREVRAFITEANTVMPY